MDNQDFENSSREFTDEEILENILNSRTKSDISSEETTSETTEASDFNNEAPKPRKKKKRKKKSVLPGIILAFFIVGIALGLSAVIVKVGAEVLAAGKPDEKLTITIPENSTTEDIAQILVNNGVISYPTVFRLVSKIDGAGGSYIAGGHEINKNMPYSTLIEQLQKAAIQERITVKVTIPEGKTIPEAAKILEDNGVCSAEEFIKEFNSAELGYSFEDTVVDSSMKFYRMEGYLFPDTYFFFEDSEPIDVVKKIYDNFSEKMNPKILGRMEELNMTIEETLTLASIIQAEASGTIEMQNVASVFHNRLNNSDEFPKLQSDPTKKYVRETIIPNSAVANDEMCLAYDTYESEGLPPGPICNPGMAAIKAALYPNDTDYYFFCSNLDTREFYFAKTNAQHENNLIKAGLK